MDETSNHQVVSLRGKQIYSHCMSVVELVFGTQHRKVKNYGQLAA